MSIIPFGKYKGQDVASVPSNYLDWVRDQEWFERKYPDLFDEVNTEYQIRERSYAHFYDER